MDEDRRRARLVATVITVIGLVGVVVAFVYKLRFDGGDRPPGQVVEFDGARAKGLVDTICEGGPRYVGAPDREARVQQLLGLLEGEVDQTAVQRFSVTEGETGERHELANIIGRLNPRASERVLVASHWDSRPDSPLDEDAARRSEPGPAASASASGAAVVLELARVLEAAGLQRVGVDLALFDGRELGPLGGPDASQGARYFAAHLSSLYPAGRRPAFAVVVDGVGDCSQVIIPEASAERAVPDLIGRIWAVALDLGFGEQFQQGDGSFAQAHDHTALIRVEVPTALLMDYDDQRRHTHEDTPERVCAESLERVGRVLQRVLLDEESGDG